MVVLVVALAACGVDGPKPAAKPAKATAAQLGDGARRPLAGLLGPDEEEALAHAGIDAEPSTMEEAEEGSEQRPSGDEGDSKTAAASIAILQVALTLGMAAAPFFAF